MPVKDLSLFLSKVLLFLKINTYFENVTFSNISTKAEGGIIYTQTMSQPFQTNIVFKDCNISGIRSQKAGLIYANQRLMNIQLINVKVDDVITESNYSTTVDDYFRIKNAVQVKSIGNIFKYCALSKNGGVFNLYQSIFEDSESLYQYNSGIQGGVINAQETQMTLTNSKFQNNIAKTGGVIFAVSDSKLIISNCEFSNNIAQESAGVIFLSTQSMMKISNSKFTQNEAFQNSAIEVLSSKLNENILITSSEFSENIATKNTLSFIYSVVTISKTQFLYNVAKQRSNKAFSKGGAIFISGFLDIQISEGTLFDGNLAFDNGEDIYVTNSNKTICLSQVTINKRNSQNSIFIEQAKLKADQLKLVDITNSNGQSLGAAINCNYCKGLQISNSEFQNFRSFYGGAIYITDMDQSKGTSYEEVNQKYSFENTNFMNCSSNIGGAIYSNNPQSMIIKNCAFERNKVYYSNMQTYNYQDYLGSGGAVYFTCNSDLLNCKLTISGVNTFKDNYAQIQGGAIYWDELEPIFQQENINFINNSADQYGDDIASIAQNLKSINLEQYLNHLKKIGLMTEKRRLQLTKISQEFIQSNQTDEINQQRSGGNVKTLYLALIDKYGQIIGSDFKSKVRVTVETSNLDQQQSMYPPIIEGGINYLMIGGIAVIEDLCFVGTPGVSFELIFSTDGIDVTKKSNVEAMNLQNTTNLDLSIKMNVRECLIGEQFTSSGKCESCVDSFSLTQMKVPGECEECPAGKAICYGGSNIGPLPGYWRKSNYSKTFIQCMQQQACLGMVPPNNNPLGECSQGYKGILCGTCNKGYSRVDNNQCSQCPQPILNVLRLLAIMIGFILIVVLMIRSTLMSAKDKQNYTNIFQKILLNHFQLLMMSASFDFQWSQQISEFLSSSKQVATVSTQIISFDCFLDENASNESQESRLFFQKLIIIGFLPFLLTFICILVWLILKKLSSKRIHITDRIISSLVILLFLAHPSLVQYSFSNFICRDIDGESRIQDDLEILCWNTQHKFYSYYVAIPSIIVWGLGIPFFALIILERINKQLDKIQIRQKYGFLYRGYKIDYYYWEIVIMYRKILIILIAVFVSNFGVIAQSLFMLFVLLGFLMVNLQKEPFQIKELNDLESLSLITSMITIYCGLFFILNKPLQWIEQNPDDSRGAISLDNNSQRSLLAFILLSNIVFLLFWLLKMYSEIRSKLRSKLTKFYLIVCLCFNQNRLNQEFVEEDIKLQNDQYYDELNKMLTNIASKFRTQELKFTKNNAEKLLILFSVESFDKIMKQNHSSKESSGRSIIKSRKQKWKKNSDKSTIDLYQSTTNLQEYRYNAEQTQNSTYYLDEFEDDQQSIDNRNSSDRESIKFSDNQYRRKSKSSASLKSNQNSKNSSKIMVIADSKKNMIQMSQFFKKKITQQSNEQLQKINSLSQSHIERRNEQNKLRNLKTVTFQNQTTEVNIDFRNSIQEENWDRNTEDDHSIEISNHTLESQSQTKNLRINNSSNLQQSIDYVNFSGQQENVIIIKKKMKFNKNTVKARPIEERMKESFFNDKIKARILINKDRKVQRIKQQENKTQSMKKISENQQSCLKKQTQNSQYIEIDELYDPKKLHENVNQGIDIEKNPKQENYIGKAIWNPSQKEEADVISDFSRDFSQELNLLIKEQQSTEDLKVFEKYDSNSYLNQEIEQLNLQIQLGESKQAKVSQQDLDRNLNFSENKSNSSKILSSSGQSNKQFKQPLKINDWISDEDY
ncbi:UNKNOWN [Stylonychia lemnae]|uniref:Transmembrane protein n=1 Tax=Stylonychia lemnae TaxID=5949 RepID=A0A078AT17_STYLE|nr:UNKNOWN [Stylonychia lemnae]|eukprot:CDW85156.1 UNKNOWN [Stylonychia lemnae]